MNTNKIMVLSAAIVTLVTALNGWGAICDSAYDWYSREQLPLEGQGFGDMGKDGKDDRFFARIPASYKGKIPSGVWGSSRNATGVNIRFRSDAKRLAIKWSLTNRTNIDPLIPPAGVQGVDVYAQGKDGVWRFCGNKRYHGPGFSVPSNNVAEAEFGWTPGETGIIYLPTRGNVIDFRVGVEKGKKFERAPHAPGHEKPIVHYGTSIVHGGCASRPGLTFTAICGRMIDRNYINLGFSGCGKMELEMADLLAAIDTDLYVVDCVWNMGSENGKLIRENTVPFLKKLHSLRPNTRILLCEGCNSWANRMRQNDIIRAEYERLLKEDPTAREWLGYFPEEEMLVRGDLEQTHDFCHPNDHGSMILGPAYARRLQTEL